MKKEKYIFFLHGIMDILKTVKFDMSMLSSKYFSVIIVIFAMVLGRLWTPTLPPWILEMLQSPLVRLLAIGVILATRKIHICLGILISLAFIMVMQASNNHKEKMVTGELYRVNSKTQTE